MACSPGTVEEWERPCPSVLVRKPLPSVPLTSSSVQEGQKVCTGLWGSEKEQGTCTVNPLATAHTGELPVPRSVYTVEPTASCRAKSYEMVLGLRVRGRGAPRAPGERGPGRGDSDRSTEAGFTERLGTGHCDSASRRVTDSSQQLREVGFIIHVSQKRKMGLKHFSDGCGAHRWGAVSGSGQPRLWSPLPGPCVGITGSSNIVGPNPLFYQRGGCSSGRGVCLKIMWKVLAENARNLVIRLSSPGPQRGWHPEGWRCLLPHGTTSLAGPGRRVATSSCPRMAPSLPPLSLVLWGALLWASFLPGRAWGARTFTLGVLGPWDCDPIFARALPSVAAQLAVDRANRDPSLLPGSRLASVVLPTGCDAPQALATFLAHENTVAAFVGPVNPGYCPAAALLAQGWGKTLFSWACGVPEGGGELVPTLPPAAHVLLSVMKHFGWARVAIVSSHQDIWVATARQVALTLRTHGLPVVLETSLGPGEQGAAEVLKQLWGMDGLKSKCTRCPPPGGSLSLTRLPRGFPPHQTPG